MRDQRTHDRYLLVLAVLFGAWFVWLALSPLDRHNWALENLLTVVAVVVVGTTRRVLPLSRISYTLLFVFLCMHAVGAHYSYAKVPYDAWTSATFGFRVNDLLGWERNHFDRLVHFSYGLLLAYPVREVFLRIGDLKGFWGYFLPLDLTMSTSMLFELFEWGAAELFGGDLGIAYLGSQGDPWDAQKDMALASVGALCAMLITAGLNARLQRDFAREWAESLRVKHHAPLGEDEIARLWRDRNAPSRE